MLEQNGVSGIAFEKHIGDITHDGDKTDYAVEGKVRHHEFLQLFTIFGIFGPGYLQSASNQPQREKEVNAIAHPISMSAWQTETRETSSEMLTPVSTQ